VNKAIIETLSPEECAKNIFEISGAKFDPKIATDIWPKILQHKWLLSEKLGRDVGFRVACIDFIENQDKALKEYIDYKKSDIFKDMDAQPFSRNKWEMIPDSQPPKLLIQKRIVLPLIEADLSKKHGVVPPKAIIFFGPPGTGKTHFAKAIAGFLSWWYIEILPSMLMSEGYERISVNLHNVMEKVKNLDEAVIFIDEFEEIGTSRNIASHIDKSVTNEFLKQISLFKNQGNRVLLLCATNHIGQLDPALLRPGRFDFIIPIGELDEVGRKNILKHYLSKLNAADINLDLLAKMTIRFTPADIEYLFQQVAQHSFEQEFESGHDYKVTTDTFIEFLPSIRPSLTDEIIKDFKKDCIAFSRT
jgi:SpoVK/Ycf46/Vps4 family AAA+-type ATPase